MNLFYRPTFDLRSQNREGASIQCVPDTVSPGGGDKAAGV